MDNSNITEMTEALKYLGSVAYSQSGHALVCTGVVIEFGIVCLHLDCEHHGYLECVPLNDFSEGMTLN